MPVASHHLSSRVPPHFLSTTAWALIFGALPIYVGCIEKGDTTIIGAQLEAVNEDRADCAETSSWQVLKPSEQTVVVCSGGTHLGTVHAESDVAFLRAADLVAVLALHTPADVDALRGRPIISSDEEARTVRVEDRILGVGNERGGTWSDSFTFSAKALRVEANMQLSARFDTKFGEDLSLFNIHIVIADPKELSINGQQWWDTDARSWCPPDLPTSELVVTAGDTDWHIIADKAVLKFCAWDRGTTVEVVPIIKPNDLPETLELNTIASWRRGNPG
jgi:hypothetical protein